MTDETTKQNVDEAEAGEATFMSHLIELRDRLLRIVIVVGVITACLMFVANDLYYYFSLPVSKLLPEGSKLQAIGVISPVFTPIKLAFIGAFYISIPYIIYQIWGFIAPGLYKNEKKLAIPLIISSVILFYIGMLFAYAVVIQMVIKFTVFFTPSNVSYNPDMADLLSFSLKMYFAFGIAFEVPIATFILIAAGITDPDSLAKKRPYIIVGAFIAGMLLTPPDVVSQIMLAIPMWFLFEGGIIAARIFLKERIANMKKEKEMYDDDKELSDEDLDEEFERAIREEEEINKKDPL